MSTKRKEDQPETNDGAEEAADNSEPPAKKSRGRPRIHPPKDPNAPKRPRGRPKKAEDDKSPAPAKAKAKPKQGKVVVRKSTTPGKRGRGRPKGSTKKAKGRGRPPKVAKPVEEEEPEEDAGEEEEESS